MRRKRHNPYMVLAKTKKNAKHDAGMKIALIDELNLINSDKAILLSTINNPLLTVEKIENVDLRTIYELAIHYKTDAKLPNNDCYGSHIILNYSWGHIWIVANVCSN